MGRVVWASVLDMMLTSMEHRAVSSNPVLAWNVALITEVGLSK
jgi:hypothetical protein